MFNFDQLTIDHQGKPSLAKANHRPNPLIFSGHQIPLERQAIGERRKMASSGICHLIIHKSRCQFITYGLCDYADSLLPELEQQLQRQIRTSSINPEEIRIFIRHFFEKKIGDRPVAFVTVIT